MRHSILVVALAALFAVSVIPACGGGGQGLRNATQPPLGVTSLVLPQIMSGEEVAYEIPVTGGCGGPYVLEVISGQLPDGVATDDADGSHHIRGILLEDGNFAFTIQITDTGCDPFLSTVAEFTWFVGRGPVRIVGANPPLVANAALTDPLKYQDAWGPDGRTPNGPDGIPGTADDYPASTGDDDDTPGFTIDALETIVYGQMLSYELIGAGGVPPYTCTLFDDSNDPEDDLGLPTGTAFAVNSRSIIGQPIQVGPGGKPFRVTVRIRDSVGNEAFRKFQWKIDTPPIVIATEDVGDGKAGSPYGDGISLVDGVPPLLTELVDDIPDANADPSDGSDWDDITYVPGSAPVVNTTLDGLGITLSKSGPSVDAKLKASGGRTNYPATTAVGPYKPFPPEGLQFGDEESTAGSLAGTPRRYGSFTIYVHVFSSLVPNERGQHAFRPYKFDIAPSEPPLGGKPPFGINPSWTVEGIFPTAGRATVPEFEVGAAYDPDQDGNPGLQLFADGGVPSDGLLDVPHTSESMNDATYPNGAYKWAATWPDEPNPALPPPGIGFTPDGVLSVVTPAALVRSSLKPVSFEVVDFMLPDLSPALTSPNRQSEDLNYSVGPDVNIITQSTQSLSSNYNYWSAPNRHNWNDPRQKIMKFLGFAAGPQRLALDASDLPPTQEVPAAADLAASSNALGELLSGTSSGSPDLDLLRCTVVATGWWDDMFNLNPRSARQYQHADANRGYAYYGQYGTSYSNHGNYQPSVTSVNLPDAEGITTDKLLGRYADGGQMYHFESNTHFGTFIVRTDGTVYVPFAYKKDTTYNGFGDGLLRTKPSSGLNSAFRTVQMTVSPDGRFAAMKLKRNAFNLWETATDSGFVVFSLTGEKPFGGKTYVMAGSGSSLTGGGNRIMYAPSMALTNTHLYFLIGSQSPSGTSTNSTPMYYQSWRGHYFMRYELASGDATASLLPADTASTAHTSEWYNTSGTPMQTTYQHHGPTYSSSSTYIMSETNGSYGIWPYHRYWLEDGMGLQEHNAAPTPFRVSANGKAVAFMGAQDFTSNYGTGVYSNYAWVDYEGSGARRATTSRRRCTMGSGRGYTLTHGPDEYAMWGRYTGPTPGLEISDDGLTLAFAYNSFTGNLYSSQSSTSSNNYLMRNRDNIQLAATTSGDQWATFASTDQEDVTGNTFGTPHRWRFGSLAFTADGAGLVFWGGAPIYQANSTSGTYNQSYQTAGCYYIYTVGTANSVKSMSTTTEGGSTDGVKTYTSSSPMDPSATTGSSSSGDVASNRRYGVMQPMGGFMSKSREVLYIMSYGAISTSNATACVLVGLNVKSTPSTDTITGTSHKNGEAFTLANWPSRRGFSGNYIYYPSYPLDNGYSPMKKIGTGRQVMAKDTGWVFFGSNYQYAGPGRYYYYGGPPIRSYYYGAYGYGGTGVYGFNGDLGGKVEIMSDPTLSSNTTSSAYWDLMHYLEVTRDGSRLAYVTSVYYFYDRYDQERINTIWNIDFSSGSMHSGFSRTSNTSKLESSNGRAGESMGLPPTNNSDVWYAYKKGASNETAKEIVRARLDATSNTWSFERFSGLTGRMNVLYSTR